MTFSWKEILLWKISSSSFLTQYNFSHRKPGIFFKKQKAELNFHPCWLAEVSCRYLSKIHSFFWYFNTAISLIFYSIWTPFRLTLIQHAAFGRRLNWWINSPSPITAGKLVLLRLIHPIILLRKKTSLNMFESLFLFSWMLFSLMWISQKRIQLKEGNTEYYACRGSGGSWEVRTHGPMDICPLGGTRTLTASCSFEIYVRLLYTRVLPTCLFSISLTQEPEAEVLSTAAVLCPVKAI